jgi:hypothetical protein
MCRNWLRRVRRWENASTWCFEKTNPASEGRPAGEKSSAGL